MTKALVQVVESQPINVTFGTATNPAIGRRELEREATNCVKSRGNRRASWQRWWSLPLFSMWWLWPYERTSPTKPFAFQLSCHPPHPSTLAHAQPPLPQHHSLNQYGQSTCNGGPRNALRAIFHQIPRASKRSVSQLGDSNWRSPVRTHMRHVGPLRRRQHTLRGPENV